MATTSQRQYVVTFQRATTAENEYGEEVETWTDYGAATARVRFGTAQEKREAAQESAVQTASFECLRTTTVDAVTVEDRIVFDGSNWDIVERAPLDRKSVRFTAIRTA